MHSFRWFVFCILITSRSLNLHPDVIVWHRRLMKSPQSVSGSNAATATTTQMRRNKFRSSTDWRHSSLCTPCNVSRFWNDVTMGQKQSSTRPWRRSFVGFACAKSLIMYLTRASVAMPLSRCPVVISFVLLRRLRSTLSAFSRHLRRHLLCRGKMSLCFDSMRFGEAVQFGFFC